MSVVALCYGTRPQVIKASCLADEFRRRFEVIAVDTGQHYDYELNQLLYEQLDVRRPDVFLGVGSSDHATQTAAILTRAAALFREQCPGVVVVIGDTNSTLGCALAAAQLGIPVVHVEAGLRSNDLVMAEELNRRIVDSISAALCAPSRRAAAQLRSESVLGHVAETGDVAHDVLQRNLPRAPHAPLASMGFPAGEPFALATLHRAELTNDSARFRETLRALADIPLRVAFPMHPRTASTIERLELRSDIPENVTVGKPLGYLETLAAIQQARVVVTDSGGVQREAYWLGTPCLTLRRETEWSETVDLGANHLVPPDEARGTLGSLVRASVGGAPRAWPRDAYGDGSAAVAIADSVELALQEGVPRSAAGAVLT